MHDADFAEENLLTEGQWQTIERVVLARYGMRVLRVPYASSSQQDPSAVQVAAHEATAAKAAAEGERHKATAARFKPKTKGK